MFYKVIYWDTQQYVLTVVRTKKKIYIGDFVHKLSRKIFSLKVVTFYCPTLYILNHAILPTLPLYWFL
jgi:hypothetical protein